MKIDGIAWIEEGERGAGEMPEALERLPLSPVAGFSPVPTSLR